MASVTMRSAPDTRTPRPSLAVGLRKVHLDTAERFRRVLHIPSKSQGDHVLSDIQQGKHAMKAVEVLVALSVACPEDVDAYAWVDGLRAEIAQRRTAILNETPLPELHDAQDRAEAEFDMAQRRAQVRPDCPLAQERLDEAGRALEYRTKAVRDAERENRARRRAPVGTTPLSSLWQRKDNTSHPLRATARERVGLNGNGDAA